MGYLSLHKIFSTPDFAINVYEALAKSLKLNKPTYLCTQYSVDSSWVDIVIIRLKNNKFVVKAKMDGSNYYNDFEKMLADQERQMFLDAKGYPVLQITDESV